jgi:hypothetical protein
MTSTAKIIAILTLLSLNTFPLVSSDSTRVSYIQFSTEVGGTWAHDIRLKSIINNPINAFSIGIGKQVNGSKPWHKAYGYPTVGFDLNFYNFGNGKIIGFSIGISPYITFPIYRHNNYNLNFRVSPGLNIMTRTYQTTTNPTNIAISSPINALVILGIENTIPVSERLDLFWGVNMVHISNATIKKPNVGLNSSTFYLGLRLKNSNEFSEISSPYINKLQRSSNLNIFTGLAVKEIKDPGGKKYTVAFISSEYQYAISPYTSIGGSVDAYYDDSNRIIAEEIGFDYSNKFELLKMGMAINAELKLQRLSLIGHLGIYGYNKINEGHIIYQRLGLRYSVAPRLSIHLGLKTHLNVADHFESGIVIKLY